MFPSANSRTFNPFPGSNGVLTYIGSRTDEFAYRHLRTMFELGRAKYSYYSSRDKQSMADLISDADVVINMVGKYYDTKALEDTDKFPYLNYKVSTSIAEANVEVPKAIAELCAEMQVDNLIHVSSAAANPDARGAGSTNGCSNCFWAICSFEPHSLFVAQYMHVRGMHVLFDCR